MIKKSYNLKNKVFIFLATILLVGQTLIPSGVVFGEELNRIELQEQKDDEVEQSETIESSSIETSEEPVKPPEIKAPEKVLDEGAKANDSPKMEEKKELSVEDILKFQNLYQGQDGKVYTTTGTSYVNDLSLNGVFPVQPTLAAGVNVHVPSWTNIANININYSNGVSEWGWYGSARRSCPR